MSYQSGTPFLNLPQTVGSDHRDWFDTNEAFLNLDTKMKTLWDGSSSTETILTALQEIVASLATDVSTLSGIVSGHTSTITTINESLVLINTALNALNTQVVGKFDSVGIADAYDASYGVYAVGDVVTYNGQRYVCNTAVTAAEPFDVSKWTAKDVQSELDDINSIIENVDPSVIASVTSDGVKTYSTLLSELFAALPATFKNNPLKAAHSKFEIVSGDTTNIYTIERVVDSPIIGLQYSRPYSETDNMGMAFVSMGSLGNSAVTLNHINSSNTWERGVTSTTIPGSGAIFRITS